VAAAVLALIGEADYVGRVSKLSVFFLGFASAVVVAPVLTLALLHGRIGARSAPSTLEARVARAARHWAIPADARARRNPVAVTATVLTDARAHFADHCAVCHGNDGRGDTPMGRNLYPRAPDMRLPATQAISDGELFYIIENGVRLTGMPAWGTGTAEGAEASWALVHFIRHLSTLTEAEVEKMKALNPKSLDEWRQEEEERQFLEGGTPTQKPPAPPHKHGG
jgi:mono/diheme cytochrome c family protein